MRMILVAMAMMVDGNMMHTNTDTASFSYAMIVKMMVESGSYF